MGPSHSFDIEQHVGPQYSRPSLQEIDIDPLDSRNIPSLRMIPSATTGTKHEPSCFFYLATRSVRKHNSHQPIINNPGFVDSTWLRKLHSTKGALFSRSYFD